MVSFILQNLPFSFCVPLKIMKEGVDKLVPSVLFCHTKVAHDKISYAPAVNIVGCKEGNIT